MPARCLLVFRYRKIPDDVCDNSGFHPSHTFIDLNVRCNGSVPVDKTLKEHVVRVSLFLCGQWVCVCPVVV